MFSLTRTYESGKIHRTDGLPRMACGTVSIGLRPLVRCYLSMRDEYRAKALLPRRKGVRQNGRTTPFLGTLPSRPT